MRRSMGGSVNVLSFLEDPVVRRGGPELLAGGENLLRRVHWVHISDQADIAGYLRGGEVLLTSGSGFPVGVEDQRSYIRSLASARVAALVVRADQDADVIPPAMVSEAADHGLPFIRLNHRIPFVEVTRALHERLLDAELGFLRRTDHLRGELTRLLVQDRGLGALVEHMATALGRTVVVEDASGCVVAGSAIGMPDEDLLDLWMRRRHAGGRPVGGSTVHVAPGLAWSPLHARGAPWGRVLALDHSPGMSDDDAGLLEVCAVVLNLAIAREPDFRPADAARDQLLTEVGEARTASERHLRRRAASLGTDLSGGPVVAFAVSWPEMAAWAETSGATGADYDEALQELRSRTEQLIRRWCPLALVGVRRDVVLGLLQGCPPPVDERLLGVVSRLRDELGTRLGVPLGVVAGVSGELPLAEAGRAIQEAVAAAEHAAVSADGKPVHRFRDLRLQQFLGHIARQGRLRGYVHAQIGPLLEHDRSGRSPLVETLRTYLRHNGRVTEAAHALFIERRTLYHRLRTAAELLRCDLDDHEAQLRLGVALQGLALLEAGQGRRRWRP